MSKSELEDKLAWRCKCIGLQPVRQHRFHPTRQWRFDFAFPDIMLAVEVEGLVFVGRGKDTRLDGRHVRPKGFEDDCEKYNEATILGWRVLRVTSKMIKSGTALQYIERALTEAPL